MMPYRWQDPAPPSRTSPPVAQPTPARPAPTSSPGASLIRAIYPAGLRAGWVKYERELYRFIKGLA